MKTENKVFIGGVVATCLITAGFLVYENTGSESVPTSSVAFNAEPERQPEEKEVRPEIEPPKEVIQRENHQIIQDPVPVPPAERGDGEVAKSLRELRSKADGLSNRIQENRFVINNLKHQISRLNQESKDYDSTIKSLSDENDRLRDELSGQRLYSRSDGKAQSKESSANKNSPYQLIKLFDDQAWIKVTNGRTYIVEEGDWFGNEYIVSIDAANKRVVTSAGVLVL